jgi:hypothetical protein
VISKEGRRLTTTIPGCRTDKGYGNLSILFERWCRRCASSCEPSDEMLVGLFEFDRTASYYSLGAEEDGLVVRAGMHTLASRCQLYHCRSFRRCQSPPVSKLKQSGT